MTDWILKCPQGNEYRGKCRYEMEKDGFKLYCKKLKQTGGSAISCEDSDNSDHSRPIHNKRKHPDHN